MNIDIIQTADRILQDTTGQPITDLQAQILRGTANHDSYELIAAQLQCSDGHVRDVASDLWSVLSRYFKREIRKKNVIIALTQEAMSRCLDTPEKESVKIQSSCREIWQLKRRNIVENLLRKGFSRIQVRDVMAVMDTQLCRLESD